MDQNERVLQMFRKLVVILFVIAGILCLSIPAYAAPNPSAGSVNGSVNIPAALTMTLSANSFNIGVDPGDTGNTGISPYVITATVNTNDTLGYALVEDLNTPFADNTNDTIADSDITPWVYSGNTGGWDSNTFATNQQQQIASRASAVTNDQWGLAWQFAIPGSQPSGLYGGTITVTAVGN